MKISVQKKDFHNKLNMVTVAGIGSVQCLPNNTKYETVPNAEQIYFPQRKERMQICKMFFINYFESVVHGVTGCGQNNLC